MCAPVAGTLEAISEFCLQWVFQSFLHRLWAKWDFQHSAFPNDCSLESTGCFRSPETSSCFSQWLTTPSVSLLGASSGVLHQGSQHCFHAHTPDRSLGDTEFLHSRMFIRIFREQRTFREKVQGWEVGSPSPR